MTNNKRDKAYEALLTYQPSHVAYSDLQLFRLGWDACAAEKDNYIFGLEDINKKAIPALSSAEKERDQWKTEANIREAAYEELFREHQQWRQQAEKLAEALFIFTKIHPDSMSKGCAFGVKQSQQALAAFEAFKKGKE